MPDIVDSRLANAFFDKANVSEDLIARSGFTLPKIISRQIGLGRRKQGGLWVGGRSVLTISTLSFSPNSMNRGLHVAPEELEINMPLSIIDDLSVHRGVITDIIDVRSVVGGLKIRCFKWRC